MTEPSVHEPGATADDGVAIDEREVPDATTRDRRLARRLLLVGVAWALIWAAILTFLFVFGDALSSFVV